MSYEMDIKFADGFLLVEVTGEDNYDVSHEIWMNIAQACEERDCFNVLGVSDMTNALATMEAYDHQKIFAEAGITLRHRIAWVEKNPEARKMIEFVETVLKNRNMVNGRVFSDVSEAKNWLLGGRLT